MVIPMGTVVTVCMLLCVLFANRFPVGALNTQVPQGVLRVVGFVCAAAGLWNILWFALRNITHFWGQMALGSGLLLCALSALLLLPCAHPSSAGGRSSGYGAWANRVCQLLRVDDLQPLVGWACQCR